MRKTIRIRRFISQDMFAEKKYLMVDDYVLDKSGIVVEGARTKLIIFLIVY